MTTHRYAEYKDSGFPLLGTVPKHWTLERLDARAQTHRSSVDPADLEGLEVLHYSIPAIQETGQPAQEDGNSIDSNKLVVSTTQLLVSKLNPHKQVVVLATPHAELLTVASTEFVPLVPTGESVQYLRYVWQSAVCLHYLLARCESATRSHQRVSPSDITRLQWAWPPQSEQTAIVSFLDRETAKIDALVEEQRRLIELLKEKRQAVIAHAVTKGLDQSVPTRDSGVEWLGMIPKHWDSGTLSRVADRIVVGIAEAATHAYADEGVPILRSTNIRAGRIIGEVLYVTPEFAEGRSTKLINAGDLVTVRTGNAGVTAVVPESLDGCQCFTMLITSLSQSGLSDFFCYVLNSLPSQRYFSLEGWGTAQVNISVPILKALPVAIPPLGEQHAIVEYLDGATAKLDELVAEAEVAMKLLGERRSALISAAVTGKIDVRSLSPQPEAEVA